MIREFWRLALTTELEEIVKNEEAAWRQRSRAVWLRQGDMNTNFFHKVVNSHRRVNTIDKIKVREERPELEMRECPMIDEDDNNQLMASFEAQELLECIKACARDKHPGPDGFSMAFFRQCWDIIKTELVAAVQNFYVEGVFEKSINATFVTLIPKKTGAEELNDF
ncbi:hypothetical protein MTR67_032907 [Solanum verrucosum]|uniref:Uncharacterized protein n=1 Tax=Solanum verrucosum TaxID=315347 RepID=A0AAF0U5E7_SOLVR|nr:hypothetical protein MTR67_032907 [Solanum verrucosum]